MRQEKTEPETREDNFESFLSSLWSSSTWSFLQKSTWNSKTTQEQTKNENRMLKPVGRCPTRKAAGAPFHAAAGSIGAAKIPCALRQVSLCGTLPSEVSGDVLANPSAQLVVDDSFSQ